MTSSLRLLRQTFRPTQLRGLMLDSQPIPPVLPVILGTLLSLRYELLHSQTAGGSILPVQVMAKQATGAKKNGSIFGGPGASHRKTGRPCLRLQHLSVHWIVAVMLSHDSPPTLQGVPMRRH